MSVCIHHVCMLYVKIHTCYMSFSLHLYLWSGCLCICVYILIMFLVYRRQRPEHLTAPGGMTLPRALTLCPLSHAAKSQVSQYKLSRVGEHHGLRENATGYEINTYWLIPKWRKIPQARNKKKLTDLYPLQFLAGKKEKKNRYFSTFGKR